MAPQAGTPLAVAGVYFEHFVPIQVVPCSLVGPRYRNFKIKPLYTASNSNRLLVVCVCDSFEMLGLLLLDGFVSGFAIFGLQIFQELPRPWH